MEIREYVLKIINLQFLWNILKLLFWNIFQNVLSI